MSSYKSTGLLPEILSALADAGLKSPTPIQAKSIPFLLKTDRDLFAHLPRGAGKTASYGLPMLQIVDPEIRQTQGLIMCPTREATLKVTGELKKYARHLPDIRIFAFNDKVDIEVQTENLTKATQIVAATPERCLELVRSGAMDLSQVRWFVLDGLDMLMEGDFGKPLDEIISNLPGTDRLLAYTEKITRDVEYFIADHMPETEKITLRAAKPKSPPKKEEVAAPPKEQPPVEAKSEEAPVPPMDKSESEKKPVPPKGKSSPRSAPKKKDVPVNDKISHAFCLVPPRQRYFYLIELLKEPGKDQHVLVYCRTKKRVNELANKLREDGFGALGIDIDTPAEEAGETLAKFGSREVPVLVVNEYPENGPVVDTLTHVIHFNPPTSASMYQRRMGMLGDKAGNSVLLLLDGETPRLPSIEERIGQKVAELNLTVTLPPSKKSKKPKREKSGKKENKEESTSRDNAKSEKSTSKKNNRDRSGKENGRDDNDRSRGKSRRGDDSRSKGKSRRGDEGSGRNQSKRGDDNRSRGQSRRGDDDRSRRRDSQALPRRMERVHESEVIDGPVSSKPKRLSSKDLASVIEEVKNIDPRSAGLDREWGAVYKKLEHLTWEEAIRHFVAYIVKSDVVQDMDEKEPAQEVTGIKALFRFLGKK